MHDLLEVRCAVVNRPKMNHVESLNGWCELQKNTVCQMRTDLVIMPKAGVDVAVSELAIGRRGPKAMTKVQIQNLIELGKESNSRTLSEEGGRYRSQ